MQQLQRRVNEQILERAEVDSHWRQQFLDDPETAMSTIPDSRQVREMYESSRSTESQTPEATMPTPPEGFQQLRRGLTEYILDRTTSDPTWKQQLLEDPHTALGAVDFPELQQMQQDEVRGISQATRSTTPVCSSMHHETRLQEQSMGRPRITCSAGTGAYSGRTWLAFI